MKKRWCSITLALALLLTSLLSITSLAAEVTVPTDGATLFTGDSVTITAAGDTLQLNLDEETTINRVKINESTAGGIQTFHIEVWDSSAETWENVYNNDYIGNSRSCILPEDYTTAAIRLVADSISGSTTITSLEADYQAQADNSAFMNVGYISDQWYEKGGFSMNSDQINTLTDLIMINNFQFDKNGDFYIVDGSDNAYDYFSDDAEEAATAKALMDGWVEKIENTCSNYAEGKSRLWICITGMSDAKTSSAFSDEATRVAFCEKVAQFALDYDLYGVDVDWEYPTTSASLAAFRSFMVTLAETLHESGLKCSGTVCPAYKTYWTTAMYEAVDYVSWMTYTNVTNTSTVKGQVPYYFMEELIDYSISLGCDVSKIWVGVPYFGRPTSGAAATFRQLYEAYYVNLATSATTTFVKNAAVNGTDYYVNVVQSYEDSTSGYTSQSGNRDSTLSVTYSLTENATTGSTAATATVNSASTSTGKWMYLRSTLNATELTGDGIYIEVDTDATFGSQFYYELAIGGTNYVTYRYTPEFTTAVTTDEDGTETTVSVAMIPWDEFYLEVNSDSSNLQYGDALDPDSVSGTMTFTLQIGPDTTLYLEAGNVIALDNIGFYSTEAFDDSNEEEEDTSFPKGLNHTTLNGTEYYYNGAYLLQDKVAYAVDKGCAGIMSWWVSQDIQVFNDGETLESSTVTYYGEDSLVRAVYEAIKRFTGLDMLPEDDTDDTSSDTSSDDTSSDTSSEDTSSDASSDVSSETSSDDTSSDTSSTVEYLLGDVNNDGEITTVDALLVLQAAVGLKDLDEREALAANVMVDEDITTADALMILQMAVSSS